MTSWQMPGIITNLLRQLTVQLTKTKDQIPKYSKIEPKLKDLVFCCRTDLTLRAFFTKNLYVLIEYLLKMENL